MTGAGIYCAKRGIKNTNVPLDVDFQFEPGDRFALFMQTPSCAEKLFFIFLKTNNHFSQVNK